MIHFIISNNHRVWCSSVPNLWPLWWDISVKIVPIGLGSVNWWLSFPLLSKVLWETSVKVGPSVIHSIVSYLSYASVWPTGQWWEHGFVRSLDKRRIVTTSTGEWDQSAINELCNEEWEGRFVIHVLHYNVLYLLSPLLLEVVYENPDLIWHCKWSFLYIIKEWFMRSEIYDFSRWLGISTLISWWGPMVKRWSMC